MLNQLNELLKEVLQVANSDMPVGMKYALIFYDALAGQISAYVHFGKATGYVDPSGDMQEDVDAYMEACRAVREQLMEIL